MVTREGWTAEGLAIIERPTRFSEGLTHRTSFQVLTNAECGRGAAPYSGVDCEGGCSVNSDSDLLYSERGSYLIQ